MSGFTSQLACHHRRTAILQTFLLYQDAGTDGNTIEEFDHIFITHPDAAMRRGHTHDFLVRATVYVDITPHGVDIAQTVLAGLVPA